MALGLSALSALSTGFSIINAGAGNDWYDDYHNSENYSNQSVNVESDTSNENELRFKEVYESIKNGDIAYTTLSSLEKYCHLCIGVPFTGLDWMATPCFLNDIYIIDEANQSIVLLKLSQQTFKSVFGSKYATEDKLNLQNFTFKKID